MGVEYLIKSFNFFYQRYLLFTSDLMEPSAYKNAFWKKNAQPP